MRTSLLCETVIGRTMAELIGCRDAAISADMVELRLDGVANLDVDGALADRRRPVIVTCRPAWEGGRFDGSEERRRAVLIRALERGAEYVDVEWKSGFGDVIAQYPGRVVVSSHDFDGVPVDLVSRARAMRETGAAVIKIAAMALRLVDTLPLLEVARDGDAVVIGMGDAGVPTRLLASRFGSRWTYAGGGVAPGQIPARRMLEEFRFRGVGANTTVFGLLGENVMRSPLPALHNAAFAGAGLDAVSVPLPAADLTDGHAFARALGIINITERFDVGSYVQDGLAALIAGASALKQTGH